MSDSTLIQYLVEGSDASVSNRRQIETFLCSGPITKGDWVSFDVSKTGADKVLFVEQAPNAAAGTFVAGVAIEDADGTATPARVKVIVRGYYPEANVLTGVAAGQALAMSGTAGRAKNAAYIADGSGAAAAPLPTECGVALTTAAANKAEVWIYKRF